MKQQSAHKHDVRALGALGASALFGLTVTAVIAWATPSQAQEDGAKIWARGGCSECHGGLATGGGGGENPAGPNLRRTKLDRAAMKETISCGRGEMPWHLKGAWTEVSCYGAPKGTTPVGRTGSQFTAAEIDSLVEFLFANVVGKNTIRKADCAVFFGGDVNHPACEQYPR